MFSQNTSRKISKLTFVSVAALSIGAASAYASPQPWVSSVKIAGTAAGCEPAEIGASSWDNLVSFDTPYFDLWLGSDNRIERKNCQLTANVEAPEGWTYAVDTIKMSGWAHVGGDVDATTSLSFYTQGNAETFTAKRDFSDWFRGGYHLVLNVGGHDWVPCGQANRALNINTALLARKSPDSNGWAYLKANESIELKLKWKRCY